MLCRVSGARTFYKGTSFARSSTRLTLVVQGLFSAARTESQLAAGTAFVGQNSGGVLCVVFLFRVLVIVLALALLAGSGEAKTIAAIEVRRRRIVLRCILSVERCEYGFESSGLSA